MKKNRKRKRDESSLSDKEREREAKKRKIELAVRSKSHKESIKRATKANRKSKSRGSVRCNKLPFRFSKGPKTWPNVDGFMNVNVCSGSNQIYKELSPMKLGPIEVNVVNSRNKIKIRTAKNLENLWQASKVWEDDVYMDTGMPKKEWFKRRSRYFKDKKAHRHIKKSKTNKNKNVSLYSLWVDQKTLEVKKLSYLEARKEVYCPIYKQLASQTKAYKKIDKLLANGTNIQILGYDGYDYETEGKTLEECYNDGSRPFGHELVLVSMLRNEKLF